jgi:hypothetical protein
MEDELSPLSSSALPFLQDDLHHPPLLMLLDDDDQDDEKEEGVAQALWGVEGVAEMPAPFQAAAES